MSSFTSNLASQARLKLCSAFGSGSKDNLSLHRWVLLKGSIIRDSSPVVFPAPDPIGLRIPSIVESEYHAVEPLQLHINPLEGSNSIESSEEQWLDSLLLGLSDDDDDDDHRSACYADVPSVVEHQPATAIPATPAILSASDLAVNAEPSRYSSSTSQLQMTLGDGGEYKLQSRLHERQVHSLAARPESTFAAATLAAHACTTVSFSPSVLIFVCSMSSHPMLEAATVCSACFSINGVRCLS